MNTYADMARTILSRREHANSPRPTEIDRIKAKFVEFVLKRNHQDLINLLLEWHNLYENTSGTIAALYELLKQDNTNITVTLNSSQKLNDVITFKDVFGLTIRFISYSESPHTFHWDILKEGKIIRSTHTGTNREDLTELVADYLETKG